MRSESYTCFVEIFEKQTELAPYTNVMFPKTMNELSINGEWPSLENSVIEELIAQEFWSEGKCEDQVNVLYVKVSGNWVRLYFDYSIIFWRSGDNGVHDEGADRSMYPLIDLGAQLGVVGNKITSCVGSLIDGGAQVKFKFSGGQSLTVQSINDATLIKT